MPAINAIMFITLFTFVLTAVVVFILMKVIKSRTDDL